MADEEVPVPPIDTELVISTTPRAMSLELYADYMYLQARYIATRTASLAPRKRAKRLKRVPENNVEEALAQEEAERERILQEEIK